MKSIFKLVALVFLIQSCAPESQVYKERQDLSPEIEWKKEDVKTFTIPITEADKTYALSLELRYISGYPWDKAKVNAKITSPSGKVENKIYEMQIRDAEGNYQGNPGMDLWDSEHLVDESLSLPETGNYTIEFTHDMPKDPFPFVLELGVILNKK